MSKISIKSFTCTKCGHKGEFRKYDSVNVSLDPSLREKVLSGEIFQWECPKCGATLSVRYDLLYHDMDKDFQIYYSPANCDGINKMINDMLTKYSEMRKLCRTVDSLNALREKIYIFESGLNDIAIELAKVVIKHEKQNAIPWGSELRFEKLILSEVVESHGHLVFRQLIDGQPQEGLILFDKANYDNFVGEITSNDEFKMNLYCDTINEKWIIDRFSLSYDRKS